MVENALRWPMMDLLGKDMDFNTADGFGVVLETRLTLVLVNMKDLGGAG